MQQMQPMQPMQPMQMQVYPLQQKPYAYSTSHSGVASTSIEGQVGLSHGSISRHVDLPKAIQIQKPVQQPADVVNEVVRASSAERKSGEVWKKLSKSSWYFAQLAAQASIASYGSPYVKENIAPLTQNAERSLLPKVKKTQLNLASPFPGNDSYFEYADLWEEIKQGTCKHSCFIDEESTSTQVWVLAVQMADGQSRLYCSFRGTEDGKDVKTDTEFHKVKGLDELGQLAQGWRENVTDGIINNCAFHRGFYGQYCAVESALREELEKGFAALGARRRSILIVCGHSMGGAIANICHFDLLASGFADPETTHLVTIGCGPVTNSAAADEHDRWCKVD